MNIIDKLMSFDKGLLKNPTAQISLRLKKLNNEEFCFPLEALNPRIYSEIQEDMFKVSARKKSDKIDLNMSSYNSKLRTVVEGCPIVFKNEGLQRKFGARSSAELVEILLTSGELDTLTEKISELSGYDEEDDIKN